MVRIHLARNRRTKQYRWRAVSPNGRSIAIGGETYTERRGAMNGLLAFTKAITEGNFVIVEDATAKRLK